MEKVINCRTCSTPLILGDNWRECDAKRHSYTCKHCDNARRAAAKTPEEIKKYNAITNPRYNPLKRYLRETEQGKAVYAKKSEHPKLYDSHPPGTYFKNNDGHYVLQSNFKKDKKEANEVGYIYVAWNAAWPDCVKIGKTEDIDKRLSQYHTGEPYRDMEFIYSIPTNSMSKTEKEAHNLARKLTKKKIGYEWFNITKEQSIDILNSLKEQDEPRKRSA